MFCGVLLSASHHKAKENRDLSPLFAQTTDLNVRVVSDSGQGSADLTYVIDKEYDNLAFYVPHLIAHQGTTRQRVKLTHCQISVTNVSTGKTEDCALQLSKLVRTQYLEHVDSLPSYTELKKQYKDIIFSKYAGAHSSEDVLLHLGKLSPSSQLKIHVEFLVKFDSPSALHTISFEPTLSSSQVTVPHWQYMIQNVLPTKKLKYALTFASSLPVEKVVASPPIENELNWRYLGDKEFLQNVVHVVCELESPTELTHPISCAFSITFTPGLLSSCYTSCVTDDNETYKMSSTHLNNSLQQQMTTAHFTQQKWDAVMMLNITLSRNQLPYQERQLYPSEFLFVIDCSGSMSGSNIQSAADMLVTCIKSLPSGCFFNVIAFGSHFRQLFHASEKYSKRTVERAVVFASQLQATLGGTDLLPPLQWIFKKPRCGSLPRQLFVITDGGVTNTQQVLSLIKRNKYQARCHTFGIGSDVCLELVTGVAAISGGRCILLKEGERLQTKVMEVLKESLQPTIKNVSLEWNIPRGYLLTDATPTSFHTMYVGSTYTAYAFLQRISEEDAACDCPCAGSAVVLGAIGEDMEDVRIDINPTTLSVLQDTKFASVINQNSLWSKLLDLEQQAATMPRNISQSVCAHEEKPEAKRPRLIDSRNGYGSADFSPSVHKQLLDISLLSHIPSPITYFTSAKTGRQIFQVLPYEKSSTTVANNTRSRSKYGRRHNHRRRRRRMMSTDSSSFSFTAIARNALSNVGSHLKSVFGLFLPETSSVATNDIQMLEDEVEYQEKRGSQLQLDNSHNLVYPSFYYSQPAGLEAPSKIESGSQYTLGSTHCSKPSPLKMSTDNTITKYSTDNEDEVAISGTESDSSVDPDWDNLNQPNDHLPLIRMQLFCGAWPLVKQFSNAVGVPLEEIMKLPLVDKYQLSPRTIETPNCSSSNMEDEAKANFWCTALALACLEERFCHLSIEWELVAYKGRKWLEQNQYQCNLTLDVVSLESRRLIIKRP